MNDFPPAFDPASVRSRFPSLARKIAGREVIFADGPGGTQTPQSVIAAMTAYLERSNANLGGVFITSREPTQVIADGRVAAALFLNAASPDEIVFGQNMTSLTFAMSRAIARTWKPGDEIVVTTLDHDANVAPWLMAAEDRGVMVKKLRFTESDCVVSVEALRSLLSPRTRLVALGWASNAVGTIVDLAPLLAIARGVGALTYVDAVHYAPHGVIDVRALDCDFLACSAYKFCGPHLGIMYGQKRHLERLDAYKVRPSSSVPPGKWETGTQNFEAVAGLRACLAYLCSIATDAGNHGVSRELLVNAIQRIAAHEQTLSRRFLDGVATIPGLRLYGITDAKRADLRTPTFGFTLTGCTPRQASERLAERGIFVWDGHFYAKELVEQLGLAEAGGLIRIGFAHYNTLAEVDRVLQELRALAA